MANKTKTRVSRRSKLKTMAYGFRRRFRRSSRRSFGGSRRFFRRNYSSINLVSMKGKSILWVVILGVLGYVFKDKLIPMIQKITNKK